MKRAALRPAIGLAIALGLLAGIAPVRAQDATAPEAAPAAAGRPLPRLVIDAPEPLKSLLAQSLDLARALALPEAGTISDAEWSRLIAAMPAQAEDLARTAGHFEARAETEISGGGEQAIEVRLRVSPGPVVRVGRVTFEVQGELQDRAQAGEAEAVALMAELQKSWALPVGQPFDNEAWEDAKTAVLAPLRSAGYAAAGWSGTAAEVDPGRQQVRIFVVADSGPLYRAGLIDVSGLQHHDADRVRDLAGFGPGDALTEARIQEYHERLSKTGLFDQVSVAVDPDPDRAGTATVRVRMRETPLQSATAALGYSTSSGPRAALEYTHRRVFGYAVSATQKVEWGQDRQAWSGEVSTHLDRRLQRDLVGGQVERLLTDEDLVISQRLRIGRAQERPSLERLHYLGLDGTEECTREGSKFTHCAALRALSLNTRNAWKQVDSVLLPTRGTTLTTELGAGYTQGTESRNGAFGRLYGRITGYWPLGRWYTQARLEGGRVVTPAGVQVPDTLRFRAGGDNSVRGYAWRTLAPTTADGGLTGGRMLLTGSVEAAHPLSASMPSLWGAVFLDAGRAGDQLRELNPALGYGVGLRWRSPVGPLSVDWAWGQDVHRGRLHLNVGIAF